MAKRLKPKKGDSNNTIRYGMPTGKGELALGDSKRIEAIANHIEKHLGDPETVLHEIFSEYVHVDIHVVKPTKKRPYWFLVTSGMSDKPMTTPPGLEELAFTELAIAVPARWNVLDVSNEELSWPIVWLKSLARFPHVFETWIFYGHSMPMEEDIAAKGTKFVAAVLDYDSELPRSFQRLKVGKTSTYFMTPHPLYQEELDYLLANDSDALSKALQQLGDYDTYDANRPNACTPEALARLNAKKKKKPTVKRATTPRKAAKKEPASKKKPTARPKRL
jgi:hypothetical protein